MAKFQAADAVDPIEINLQPYADVEGAMPEPTTDQVTAFQNSFFDAAGVIGMRPGQKLTPDMAAELNEADAVKMYDIIQDSLVEVTGGFVSREDLAKLPFRVMTAFIAWLAGELAPEAPTPGTTR